VVMGKAGGAWWGWWCLVVGLVAGGSLISGDSSSKNTAGSLAMREEGKWKRRNGWCLPCLDIFL